MTRVVFLLLAAALLLVDGVVYGRWTDRWGNGQAVEDAVTQLEQIPLRIGGWQAKPLAPAGAHAAQAGCAGFWVRRYERQHDGAVVDVLLACGRPGPLAVHTPDICYTGSGYVQAEAVGLYTADAAEGAAPATFWQTRFNKPEALVPVSLRLLWSWHTAAGWHAARNPRLEFAGAPVLHKLYVIREMDGRDDRRDDAICAEFLTAFLPAFAAERSPYEKSISHLP